MAPRAFLFRQNCIAALPAHASIAIMLAASAGFMAAHLDRAETSPSVFDARPAWDILAHAYLQERSPAQSVPPTLKLIAAGNASDGDGRNPRGARILAAFESDGHAYAAVAPSFPDERGVRILDLSDPRDITVADAITHEDDPRLGYAWADMSIFESNGRIYAAMAGYGGRIQILEMSDPRDITMAGSASSSGDSVATFKSDGHAYAAVSSYLGIQILNLTDPYNVTHTSSAAYGGHSPHAGPSSIAAFESDGHAYAAVASAFDDTFRVLDLADPRDITMAGSIADNDRLLLGGVVDIDTFESDGRIYAAVAAAADGGVQILDVSDPRDITMAGGIAGDHDPHLAGPIRIDAFESNGRIYAAVIWHGSIQILELTDPHDITLAGSIADNDDIGLDYTWDVSAFESDGRAYAAVTSSHYDVVHILELADPRDIAVSASITADAVYLFGALDLDIFESNGHAYAAVASFFDDGVQVVEITDPHDITIAGGIGGIKEASRIAAFESNGRAYAAVIWHGGVHILELADPHDIAISDSIADGDGLEIGGAGGIAAFESSGRAYAAVASYDGIHVIEITDPHDITMAGGIKDNGSLHLGRAADIAAFESNGRAYAAVASYDGVQVVEITDPHNIAAVSTAGAASPRLYDAKYVAAFELNDSVYAAVISASGSYNYNIQILDVSDPHNMAAAGHSRAGGLPAGITVLEMDGRTYLVVALQNRGAHVYELTDPHEITPAGGGATAFGDFEHMTGIAAFGLDGRTYLAATSHYSVQTLLVAATEPDACTVHAADASAPAIPPEIAAAGNRFAVDLYRQISGDGGNAFFSPISVYVAFSAVGEAARGETAGQLYGAFGFEPDENLRRNATAMLVSSLNRPDPCATLQMASSLWLAERFEPYDSYVGMVGDSYMADIETVDFLGGGVGRINGWAAEKTQGKIPKVLDADAIPQNMTAAVLNAIYFKGAWEEPFPVGNTHESDFWTGTKEVRADFMGMTTQFGYTGSDQVQVLSMPYRGDRLSMLVMLPADRDGLERLGRAITPELVGEWQEEMHPTLVRALVPKFEMNARYNLTSPLVNMGVNDVFDPRASDLSGMAHLEHDQKLYISIATQDAYIKVNEEGTEAAAVTTISGGGSNESLPPEPVPFIADHPFLFVIQDDESGAILFMGRVSDPS